MTAEDLVTAIADAARALEEIEDQLVAADALDAETVNGVREDLTDIRSALVDAGLEELMPDAE